MGLLWSGGSVGGGGKARGQAGGLGVPGIDGAQVAAVHLLADLQRTVGELDGARPARALRGRIDPVLLGDGGVAAEDEASAAALRLAGPAGAARQQRRVLEARAHHARLAAQVDPEVVDERPGPARLLELV